MLPLFLRNVSNWSVSTPRNLSLGLGSASCNSTLVNTKAKPGRVVFISQSYDVFANLAFEDWLYKNWDFAKRNALFIWRNSPCVVIGRHQNPYTEVNIDYLDMVGVPVVRRNSGGGTVYHDEGNVNCSFFTSRERYDRRRNLDVICAALQRDFNVPAAINKKDDIVVGSGFKVSGTAAKLGRLTAYHHCTLLVSSDKHQLSLTLKGDKTIASKATKSVPSSVTTLQEIVPNLTVEKVLASIGSAFLQQRSSSASSSRGPGTAIESQRQSDGFTLINPTEEWFPGLDEIKEGLKSWEWLYGMTPHFKQTRPVALDPSFSVGSTIMVSVEVNRGTIKSISVESNVGHKFKCFMEEQIAKSLIGTRYSPDVFVEIESQLSLKKEQALASANCL